MTLIEIKIRNKSHNIIYDFKLKNDKICYDFSLFRYLFKIYPI